jgi:hypothetical protein
MATVPQQQREEAFRFAIRTLRRVATVGEREFPDIAARASALANEMARAEVPDMIVGPGNPLPRCPYCKAEPGEPCVQVRGHFPGLPLEWFGSRSVHKSRKAGA